jgi:glutaredoxin
VKRIDFYTREHCHLCHEALDELRLVREQHPFELVVIDLDRDASADKRSAYDHEVPVVELDGRKIMKFHVDCGRLLRLLALET